ncbi:heparinase II/III family protein [Pelagicoccus sp. SDUM812002]|uniref:heparinase II/III domain-containing protein n=1 Tax=Pelagicoccus sp. SDUM812002 TaxID=3041266 RepID=UPI0028101411|nr:heparinase II/III family protein [Pelagicoccus sp. SDUM812002]MDQ8188412.1 heparinase II/III family protein [Pelagicoccus sp. SDUM812002]
MKITRRDALKRGGVAIAGASFLPFWLRGAAPSNTGTGRLFFDKADVPRIRANARSVLLGSKFEEWAAASPQSIASAWETFATTGNISGDLGTFWAEMEHSAVVHIVEPTEERRDALLAGFENAVALPKWDYLMDGEETIGLMRAAMAVSRLLFVREALGDDFSDDLNERFLDSLAEKGAGPCFRMIRGMNDPEGVVGWHNDPEHPKINDFNMENWPTFLGGTNLRATSTMGLGMAALALNGRDSRSKGWLDTAVESAHSVFSQFTASGNYFEGLSYSAYAMRLLLPFCEAHHRVLGTIDWTDAINWAGYVDDVATMQAGEKADGTPDVVNFSDASSSIHPCVGSWIQARTGNPVAQYAAEHFAAPGYFLDFLWYRPDEHSEPPREALKNVCNDLDWVICRSGWEAGDAVLAFRSGNPANHEHADRNSFLYKVYGERLLNDPFGAAYDRRDPKWTLRLTKAHNAVLIGGRGHQYHEGEEGVNAGAANAEIVSFVDEGERVWWSSDATHAYRLANQNVSKVMRTVFFFKPNVMVVFDQVDLQRVEESVEIRYFPDNRDGMASVSKKGAQFELKRPQATLYGAFAANTPLSVRKEKIDFSEDLVAGVTLNGSENLGEYPFVRAHSSRAKRHELCTVMVAEKTGGEEAPTIDIRQRGHRWHLEVNTMKGILNTEKAIPEMEWKNES